MLRALPPKVAAAAGTLKPAGDQWMAICPAHEDGTPSLAIKQSDTGNWLLYDHGGCQTEQIIAAWGIQMVDLMNPETGRSRPDGEWTPEGPATDIYHYCDEQGEILYDVLRIPKPGGKKTFRQRRPDKTMKSGWAWNLQGTRRVLYRLPQVLEAIQRGETIVIVEGEKDVHTLEALGKTATCNSGGAGKFLPEHADIFADGVKVAIIADADNTGRDHARKVRALLQNVGANVTTYEPADGTKDITEHLNAGLTINDLLVIEDPGTPDYGLIDIHELLKTEDQEYDWLIPNLLEKGERLIITGMEGSGKSYLLRQIAIMTAAGIHPLIHTNNRTIQTFTPQKILWIDAENSRRQNKRAMAPLVHLTQQLGQQIPTGHFTLALRPEGLDLTKGQDPEWLEERIQITKPNLLIIGPYYRLFNNDPSDETASRNVIQTIDTLRAKYNFTTIMEAHSPHTTGQPNKRGGIRPVRPIGSSILLRWPEYGYGLSFRDNNDPNQPDINGLPDLTYADWLAWRGARDERNWPQALTRGTLPGDPPWLATDQQPPNTTPNQRHDHQTRTDIRNAYTNGRGGTRTPYAD